MKFSAAAISALIAAIEAGQTTKAACVTAGISKASFQAWMRAGAEGDPLKAAFRDRIHAAMTLRAQRELTAVLATLRSEAPAPALRVRAEQIARSRA